MCCFQHLSACRENHAVRTRRWRGDSQEESPSRKSHSLGGNRHYEGQPVQGKSSAGCWDAVDAAGQRNNTLRQTHPLEIFTPGDGFRFGKIKELGSR